MDFDYNRNNGSGYNNYIMLGVAIAAVTVVVVVIAVIIKSKKKVDRYTSVSYEPYSVSQKDNFEYFSAPQTESRDQRMSPNTKMPTLSGLDTGGNVYVDDDATSIIGGVKAPLGWVL